MMETSSTSARSKVKQLLEEAQVACHRPLFEEVELAPTTQRSCEDEPFAKRFKRGQRSWEMILVEASKLLPFMTSTEHDLVAKYASIYFLGFLHPYSTGCDFFTLKSSADFTPSTFIEMGLEERLENTCRFFAANDFGEADVVANERRDKAFEGFVQNGLAAFCSARAASTVETDVLHLIAMAISPRVNTDLVGSIVAHWEEVQAPAWVEASRLIECLYANSFPLHAQHRLSLVKFVRNNLLLPETGEVPNRILAGAVPHLLASLHTFSRRVSTADAHIAHEAMIQVVIQTGQESLVREVFYSVLSHTIEDQNPCKCHDDQKRFCPHASRGELLRDCITAFNGSRYFADAKFTEQVLLALKASIEEQMTPWQAESQEKPTSCSACLLSSLLRAAESLFYFILAQGIVVTELIEMTVQLLHHPDAKVCKAASSMLSVAFSYTEISDRLLSSVLRSVKANLDLKFDRIIDTDFSSLSPVITVAARKSNAFANSFLSLLIEERKTGKWRSNDSASDDFISIGLCRMISSVASANPSSAFRRTQDIREMFGNENSSPAKDHLAVALLSTRLAQSFSPDGQETIGASIEGHISATPNRWRMFQFARHSLITGNFDIAKSVFEQLLRFSSSEESFLWLSSLSKLAQAEGLLHRSGSKGIPDATILLQAAIAYVESISSQTRLSMAFQVEFLRARLDFLDISSATRLLCREVRLSGTIPKDSTRVGIHLVNTLKSWEVLANRYGKLYRQHGLFLCQHSRSMIRNLHATCWLIGSFGMQLLSDALPGASSGTNTSALPRGDAMHPTIRLLRKIQESVLSKMDKFVDPTVRATVLGELLEGVHLSPIPFPKSFFSSMKIAPAKLRVSLDPSQRTTHLVDLNSMAVSSGIESATIRLGSSLMVYASGSIPSEIINRAATSFTQLLLLIHIERVGQLDNEYGEYDGDTASASGDALDVSLPSFKGKVEFNLSKSGNFSTTQELPAFISTGIFQVDFTLSCRDLTCGEFELPVVSHRSTLMIRVSRRTKEA